MKNRKKGFSLVELLIVLAVIAALIATITPVALNAIRKAQATKVAQNIKTLASALENAAYVNGVSSNQIMRDVSNTFSGSADISYLGRDIDSGNYGVWYKYDNGKVNAVVFSKESIDTQTAKTVLEDLKDKTEVSTYMAVFTGTYVTLGLTTTTDAVIYYFFEFNVY
ncbi:MAG: Uncharacterized protein XE05_1915 [Thermotogales bacterium 46_20]|nr:MAG: Uncharacterized protein XE05_1915 [Thermotogales bacterium 46_20]